MFARVSALLLIVPCLVAATVVPRGGGPAVNACNTGPVQCCNSVQNASSPSASTLAGLLGIVLSPISGTGQVGINCSPILSLSDHSCTSQPVCCTNNDFNGLVNIGCTPINVSL